MGEGVIPHHSKFKHLGSISQNDGKTNEDIPYYEAPTLT